MSAAIDVGQLGALTEIDDGQYGTVYRVSTHTVGRGPAVFKRYKPAALADLNQPVLQQLIGLLETLPYRDGQRLSERAAWPASMVSDNGAPVGFLMGEIPADFYQTLTLPGATTSNRTVAGVHLLLNSDSYLHRVGIPITDRMRLELLRDTAQSLDLLHGLGVTVGDLSAKNLLFSLNSRPRCFFIDCDSMAIHGRSVLPQVETPDWDVAAVTGEPKATSAADAYKFGLLAVRLFARGQSTRNPDDASGLPDELRALAGLALAADPATRPAPREWLAALDRHIPHAATSPVPPPTPPGPPPNQTLTRNPVQHTIRVPPFGPVAPPPPPTRPRRRRLAAVTGALVAVLLAGTAYALFASPGGDAAATAPDTTAGTSAPAGPVGSLVASSPAPPTVPPRPTATPIVDPSPGVTPPAMPIGLTATPISASAVYLQWTDNSGNETQFLILGQRSPYGAEGRAVGANTTSMTWTGLDPGTYMCFAISASNAGGFSAWYPNTDPYWICTSTLSPPQAPTGLTATATSTTTIRLQWTDNSSNETGFEIVNDDSASRTTSANTNQYDWTGIAVGTSMCFHVRAYNAVGVSAFSPASPTVCATTVGPPAAPSGLTATAVNPNAILLQWADNSANETGFTIANNSGSTRTAAANVTQYTWTGVANGATMCFQVRAYNAVGSSSYQPASPTVCATTPGGPPPPLASLELHVVSRSIIRVFWGYDYDYEVTGFEIVNNSGVTQTDDGNSAYFLWDGLSVGTTMCFRVRTFNDFGYSAYYPSSGYLCATVQALAPPTNVTATAVNPTTIRIQWTPGNNTLYNNQWNFWVTKDNGSTWNAEKNTQFDWTGLSPGTTACFSVSVISYFYDGNWSPESPIACATTPSA